MSNFRRRHGWRGTMDLIGMDVREKRKKAKFIVLRATDGQGWSSQETGVLVNALMAELSQHPRCPDAIIVKVILQVYPEQRFRELLPGREFSYQEVVGYDNPELPWIPG